MIDRLVAAARMRRVPVAIGVAVALVLGTAVLTADYRRTTTVSGGPPVLTPAQADASWRRDEISRLLAERGRAVVHHNRAAFMATVDPQSPTFRRRQRQMFADLAEVRFASWSYSMDVTSRRAPPPDAGRYGDPVWAPETFTLNFRLARFDDKPTNLRQYPTFVERAGHWYLGSLSDYAPLGLMSATDLWDYAPVSVVRRSDVLVLGPAQQRATMLDVASDVETAIPQVTSVWGSRWSQRAVVLVPQTMREMALIDEDHEDLRNIAALTSAEINATAGRPSPVGDRITINPKNWPKLSELGRQVVLRHELTHVASQAATGEQTPVWLVEGLAEYVGFKFAGVPVALGASELQDAIRAGHLPTRLPSDRDFRGADAELAAHYEAAWFACRTIAERFGEAKLVRFYRAVGTSTKTARVAVRDAMARLLDLRLPQFVVLWRADMRAELA